MTLHLLEIEGNPRPSLIWYLENTIIDETFEEEDNGVTSNALTFPRLGRQHLNARLSCQASNTNLSPPPSKVIILNINLRPLSVQIVKKQEQLSANRSYEVECIVTGSRPAPQITWWIGSRPLRDNVINSSQSNLTRSVVQLVPEAQDHERLLICHAENPHLRAKSLEDTWKLDVQYPPVCISSKNSQVFVVLEKETIELICEVNSSPPPKHFMWSFNNSKEYMDIDPKYYKSRGSTSTLLYTPSTEEDFGVVSCLAVNTAGLQDEPCSFILAAPTLPTNLRNCSVLNRSVTALQVECQEGFDGGLTQVFHMEVLELPSMNVLSNVTSNISLLAVTGLPESARAHYFLILYASNAKGRSAISTLYTVVSRNRLTESPTPPSPSPMLGFFIALWGLLIAPICAVLAAVYRWNTTHNNRPTK
ncbi:unnamed protein product [Pieris brassicae]|uniref:Ig-like domain-containing protein n=1 Tax=Pieris brassicae TaxID=7116 RepID=A0A9P0TRD8_PIEBR|nr:unnamed protein product [Pieris brassicae]